MEEFDEVFLFDEEDDEGLEVVFSLIMLLIYFLIGILLEEMVCY